MTEPGQVRAVVRRVIFDLWPDRFAELELLDERPMGENGLGLDSIELAQVVLACEEETGVTVTEEVFGEGPLTVGALVVYLSRS